MDIRATGNVRFFRTFLRVMRERIEPQTPLPIRELIPRHMLGNLASYYSSSATDMPIAAVQYFWRPLADQLMQALPGTPLIAVELPEELFDWVRSDSANFSIIYRGLMAILNLVVRIRPATLFVQNLNPVINLLSFLYYVYLFPERSIDLISNALYMPRRIIKMLFELDPAQHKVHALLPGEDYRLFDNRSITYLTAETTVAEATKQKNNTTNKRARSQDPGNRNCKRAKAGHPAEKSTGGPVTRSISQDPENRNCKRAKAGHSAEKSTGGPVTRSISQDPENRNCKRAKAGHSAEKSTGGPVTRSMARNTVNKNELYNRLITDASLFISSSSVSVIKNHRNDHFKENRDSAQLCVKK